MTDTLITMTKTLFDNFGMTMYQISMASVFVMLFFVPFRVIWVIISHFISKSDRNILLYYISFVFLVLSIVPIVNFFLEIENGTSGLFLLFITPIPFLSYILFEIIRFIAFKIKVSSKRM